MKYEVELGSIEIQLGEGRVIRVEGLKITSDIDPNVWLKVFEAVSSALFEAGASSGVRIEELLKS